MYSLNNNWFMKCVLCICITTHLAVASQMVIYWGQESDGEEKSLREYCSDDTYDIIVVAFVHYFPTAPNSNYPGMNFAGHCGSTFNKQNPLLLNCADTIGSDITYCQSVGKKIMISLGGAEGEYGFSSDSEATTFATTVWNMFLGGTSTYRPFGTAIVDGVDLDIEQGDSTGYVAFITKLRSYFESASNTYYISAAPQCPYPDFLGPGTGTPFTSAWFDFVWIQFYNNNCGLNAYPKKFNFATWAAWATSSAVNPNMKLFIGAPASPDAAGSGYVSASTLQTIVAATQSSYPNVFGGVMLWDTSNSDANSNYGGTVAEYLHSSASTTNSQLTTSKIPVGSSSSTSAQASSSTSTSAHASSSTSTSAHAPSSTSTSEHASSTSTHVVPISSLTTSNEMNSTAIEEEQIQSDTRTSKKLAEQNRNYIVIGAVLGGALVMAGLSVAVVLIVRRKRYSSDAALIGMQQN